MSEERFRVEEREWSASNPRIWVVRDQRNATPGLADMRFGDLRAATFVARLLAKLDAIEEQAREVLAAMNADCTRQYDQGIVPDPVKAMVKALEELHD